MREVWRSGSQVHAIELEKILLRHPFFTRFTMAIQRAFRRKARSAAIWQWYAMMVFPSIVRINMA